MSRVCVLGTVLLYACWADFPARSSSPDSDQGGVDAGASDTDTMVSPADTKPPDQPGTVCTPDEILGCEGENDLRRCNPSGTAVELISCAPESCDVQLKRCTQCTPGEGSCEDDSTLISCGDDGRWAEIFCDDGCENDACCSNDDGDEASICDDDCDDNDPLVFPDQTSYQKAPRDDGTFDYNCDDEIEKRWNDTVECRRAGPGNCSGHGWMQEVPECGETLLFGTCKRSGGECQPEQSLQTQECR